MTTEVTLLKADEIEQLAGETEGLRVSIYLPTRRTGRRAAGDLICFKNLLVEAEKDLIARGVRAPLARDLLKPARDLLEDRDFWLHQAEGLAVFIKSENMRVYRLPLSVPELKVVADQYHLKPLLALLSAQSRFYLLAVRQGRVRLFRATRETIRELDLGDLPTSLRAAVDYDSKEQTLQFRTGSPAGKGGRRAAIYHGQGSPKDAKKDEIATFLRAVDSGIRGLLEGERAPLVLAGVPHIVAVYRAVTSYSHVVDDGIDGNFDNCSPEQLLEKAWGVVEPHFLSGQRAAAERYEALAGTGRAANDLSVVLRAASEGRVETFFAALGAHSWGRWTADSSQHPELHSEQSPGDRDLIDLAAVRSFLTGAEVYLVPPEQVPGRGNIAAVFRY